jgi:hypothetical protein
MPVPEGFTFIFFERLRAEEVIGCDYFFVSGRLFGGVFLLCFVFHQCFSWKFYVGKEAWFDLF